MEETINKAHPPPTFPKLGLPDDRRETPIIDTPKSLQLMGHLIARNQKPNESMYSAPRSEVYYDVNSPDKYHGMAATNVNVTSGPPSYAINDNMLDPKYSHPTYPVSTKLHEDFHQMMNRVEKKYGNEIRSAISRQMISTLPDHIKSSVVRHANTVYGKPQHDYEEMVAGVISHVNSPVARDEFHNLVNLEPEEGGVFDTHMKQAYEHFRNTAKNLSIENINKAQPTPTFPKLGLPDDRRETPIISTSQQQQLGARAVATSAVKNTGIKARPSAQKTAINTFTNELMGSGVQGATGPITTGQTAPGYALSNKLLDRRYTEASEVPVATKLHEDFHQMMNRIEGRYGLNARKQVASKLVSSLPPELLRAITRHAYVMTDSQQGPEELIAHTITYVNSPTKRLVYHNNEDMMNTPYDKRADDVKMKLALRHIRNKAATIAPKHIGIKKSEEFDELSKSLDVKKIDRVVEKVKSHLTDDLRQPQYRGKENCLAGHCYVASEAVYHMLGGQRAGWVPQSVQHEGGPHWYLKHKFSGYIIDPTASQFDTPVPYEKGVGRGFLTRQPSKRTQVVLDRIAKGHSLIKNESIGKTVKIPINNIFMLNRWGNPIRPDRLDYQVKHGSNSPPIKVSLGTSFEEQNPDYVHSQDPQYEGADFDYRPFLNNKHPKYFLSDGHHRVRAAQQRGEKFIDADIYIPSPPHYLDENRKNIYSQEISLEAGKLNNLNLIKMSDEQWMQTVKEVCTVAIFNSDGHLLMGQRNDDKKWNCPGGKMEPGENPRKAALREVLEETGIELKSVKFLGDGRGGKDGHIVVHCFEAHSDEAPNSENDPDKEVDNWEWVDVRGGLPEEFNEHTLHNGDSDVLLHILGLQSGKVETSSELSKSWKNAFIGAIAAAGLATAPAHGAEPANATAKWTPDGLHEDLHPIAHLESSGGKNIKHLPHSKGELHTAVGAVGLKPVTALEEYKKSSWLQKVFPDMHDPQKFVDGMNNNPAFYNGLASAHWQRLKRFFGGDRNKTAYAWRWGIGAAQRDTPEVQSADPYVLAYQKLWGKKNANKVAQALTNPLDTSTLPVTPQAQNRIEKSERQYFRSKDGITIPAHGTSDRVNYDKRFEQGIKEAFPGAKFNKIKVPLDKISGGTNMPVNKERLEFYKRMARHDKLPPIVVDRSGEGYYVTDGNHRAAAAGHVGLKEIDAYERVKDDDKPIKKPISKHVKLYDLNDDTHGLMTPKMTQTKYGQLFEPVEMSDVVKKIKKMGYHGYTGHTNNPNDHILFDK